MTTEQQIEYLIGELGLHIFPLRKDTKQPYAGSWYDYTTNSVTDAKAMHAGIKKIKSYSKTLNQEVEPDFTGCIFGVNMGASNKCAVDVDVGWHEKQKRNKEGFQNFQALKASNGYPKTFTVRTPSGGFHIITEGKCKSNNSTLAKDVDIKSDGAYIVAPGTVSSKGKYEVIHNVPFEPTPQWLLYAQGQRQERKEILAVPGEEMTEAQRAEIESALEYIPCEDYDTIVKRVGMALHHEYPGPDGLEVWDNWCKGLGEAYRSTLCASKWSTFGNSDDPSKDITINTLFKTAREHDWPGAGAAAAFAEDIILPDEDEPLETLSPFPIDVFNPEWARLAQQVADIAMMPVQLPAMVMLSTVSGAIGKLMEVVGGSNHGPCRGNLYVIGTAPSSTGKDVAARLADPVHEYEECLRNTAAFQCDEECEPPTLVISNSTGEALMVKLAEGDETLFSFSAEAGDLVRIAAGAYRKQGGDYSVLNAAWSGSFVRVTRINRGDTRLQKPCLSLFWAIQPDFFGELARDGEAIHSGFLPRCLCFDSEATYALDDGVRREVDSDLLNKWSLFIRTTLQHRIDAAEPKQLNCTHEATEAFLIFHNKMQERRQAEPAEAELLGKARENAIRVALVLAVMDDADQIDRTCAERAVRLIQWCLESTILMVNRHNMDRLESAAEKLYRKIKSVSGYNGVAKTRDLVRNNGYDKQALLHLVDTFPAMFDLVKVPTKGRPSERIRTK